MKKVKRDWLGEYNEIHIKGKSFIERNIPELGFYVRIEVNKQKRGVDLEKST